MVTKDSFGNIQTAGGESSCFNISLAKLDEQMLISPFIWISIIPFILHFTCLLLQARTACLSHLVPVISSLLFICHLLQYKFRNPRIRRWYLVGFQLEEHDLLLLFHQVLIEVIMQRSNLVRHISQTQPLLETVAVHFGSLIRSCICHWATELLWYPGVSWIWKEMWFVHTWAVLLIFRD